MCKKLKKALVFRKDYTMRQLSFGLLDMGWHGQDPTAITDVKALKEQFAATKLYPEVAENVMSTAFSYLSRWLFIRILQLQMGRSSGC
jgi:peptidyl-dipeptidase Dcp